MHNQERDKTQKKTKKKMQETWVLMAGIKQNNVILLVQQNSAKFIYIYSQCLFR